MMFLSIWDEVFDVLGQLVQQILNLLWMFLCGIVYPIISWLFLVFSKISTTEILNTLQLQNIINRFTIMLTIVMTFYITFEFVKYTVSPETINDKQKGAMPLFGRIIISILLLAFVPTIFSYANRIQSAVVTSNLIGKIMKLETTGSADYKVDKLGSEFAGTLFGAFVFVDCDGISEEKCQEAKDKRDKAIMQVKKSNTVMAGYFEQWNWNVEFNGLLALLFGCFVVYVMFLYCKDVALRHIQLIFLQIMSPIAIMSYILPSKDGMFQKWVKQCLTTYVDLFIRIFTLYFMFFMINVIGQKLFIDDLNSAVDKGGNLAVYLFMVAGLMMFVKKVPQLLKELFPSSGGAASIGFGFSGKDRKGILSDVVQGTMSTAARTAGMIAGVARTGKGIKDGTLLKDLSEDGKKMGRLKRYATYANTAFKSAQAGYKAGKDGSISDAIRTGQEKVQGYESIVAAGGTVLGHDYGGNYWQNHHATLKLNVEQNEKNIALNESRISNMKSVKTAQDAAEERSRAKIEAKEQKIQIQAADIGSLAKAIGSTQLSKYGISVTAGQTTSELYSVFEAKANSLKARATSMNAELVAAQVRLNTAEVAGDAEKIAIEQANISNLNEQIKSNETESVEIQTLQAKALKELERYSFTRALRGDVSNEERDPVLDAKIASAKQMLENAKADFQAQLDAAATAAERAAIETNIKATITEDVYDKIMNYTTKVTDFDSYDKVQGALTGYASSLGDTNSALKEENRRIKESAEWRISEVNSSK